MARNGVAMFRVALVQRPAPGMPWPDARGRFVLVKTRVNNVSALHPVLTQCRWSSSNKNADATAEIVQSFQGGEHEFSSSRARENLSEAIDTGNFPNQSNLNQPLQNGNGTMPKKQFAGRDEHVGKYDSQGTVSLYSVMQSTVPEPFQPTGKTGSNPTHLNMPGGGVKLKDKYLSDKRVQDTYQSMDTVSKALTGASTFVIAYAVHKVFAPARIAVTLTCTPFIVRYLRRIGFLKPPKLPK